MAPRVEYLAMDWASIEFNPTSPVPMHELGREMQALNRSSGLTQLAEEGWELVAATGTWAYLRRTVE
jgi:hypothetical protein